MGKTANKTEKPTTKVILRRSKNPFTKEEAITVIWAEAPVSRWNWTFSYNDVYLPPKEERKGDWVKAMFSPFGGHGRVDCEGSCDMCVIHQTTKPVRPDEQDAKDVLKVLAALDNETDYKVVMKVPKRLNLVG